MRQLAMRERVRNWTSLGTKLFCAERLLVAS